MRIYARDGRGPPDSTPHRVRGRELGCLHGGCVSERGMRTGVSSTVSFLRPFVLEGRLYPTLEVLRASLFQSVHTITADVCSTARTYVCALFARLLPFFCWLRRRLPPSFLLHSRLFKT